jgi:hypothetical protein
MVRDRTIAICPTKRICVFVVKDLASRFADGRLSTEKLIAADDEELAQMLIEVRGIGRVSPRFLTSSFSKHTHMCLKVDRYAFHSILTSLAETVIVSGHVRDIFPQTPGYTSRRSVKLLAALSIAVCNIT